jgi:hypothetical protein
LAKYDPSSKTHFSSAAKSPSKGNNAPESVATFLAKRVAAEEGAGTNKELEDRECVQKIQREMQMIERKNRIAQLPLFSKLQMMKGNQGMKETQLRQMVQEIESKRCQANFKSPGREHFEELQSSWVNQVEVGKYKPKYHLIEPN